MIRGVRRRVELEGLDLTSRLVVRVGALLKHRLAVTRAVLDAARPDSPLEALLLSDALLGEAPRMRAERFAELAGDVRPAPALLGPDGSGWRVLALREEILAEEGWRDAERSGTEEAGPVGTAAIEPVDPARAVDRTPGLKPLLTEEERRRFLGPERLSEARFRLLVSGKAEDKIEALRMIAFGSLPEAEKLRFLVRGLVDGDSSVRRDAGELLAGLGLHPDIVSVVRELAQGRRGVEHTLDRLGRVAGSLRDREREVALLVLTTALRDEERGPVKAGIVRALRAFVPMADEGVYRAVLPALSRALASDYRTVADAVAALLSAWRERSPEVCERLFLEEFGLASEPTVALVYASILARADLSGPGRERLASALAEGVAAGQYRGDRLWQAGDALSCLGASAFRAIRSVYARLDASGRVFLVGLLDRMHREGTLAGEARVEVAEFFLELLAAEERPVRMAVFGATLLARERFPPDVQRAIAVGFLENLRHCGANWNDRNIGAAFVGFGRNALDPLRTFLRDGLDYTGKDWAVRVLGRVVAALEPAESSRADPDVEETIRFCRRYYTLPYVTNGELARALGEMCRSPGVSPELAGEVVEEFFAKLGRVPYTADLIEALGRAALGRAVGQPLRRRIVDALLRCVRREVPREGIRVDTDTEGRLVFNWDRRAELLTELIPRAVRGLAEIALAEATAEEDRLRIADELIARRRLTLSGRVHWGPYNEEVLVRSLLRIAAGDRTTDANIARILEALEGQLYRGAIARRVGEILRARTESAVLGALAARFIAPLARRLGQAARGGLQSGLAVGDFCAALADLAGRVALGRTPEEGHRLREAVAAILLDRARGETPEAVRALRALAASPGLSEPLRGRILSRMEGLERLGHLPD